VLKFAYRGITTAFLAMGVTGSALAAEVLNMSAYPPSSHWLVKDSLGQWAEDVRRESAGRIRINSLPTPLGTAPAHFALARDGIADIALGVPGYTAGQFVLVEVAGIPKIGHTGEGLSVGLWNTFKATPELQAEFKGVKVLGLFTTDPQVPLLAKRKVEKLEDFRGLKMRVAGGMMRSVAEAAGMTPVSAPAPEAYQLLSTGVIDGIVFPISDIASFKLENLIKHVMRIPGGVAAAPIFLVMNEKRFESLSKADQEALMRASGENLSRIIGRGWDNKAKEVSELVRRHGGEMYVPSEAFMQSYDKALQPVIDAWIKQVKAERGIDGKALIDRMRSEVAKVEGAR
jgi:TRAP-type C4-dicarboxylate transport system substrate-binding protein